MERIDLKVPYQEKDQAKALGAKWDSANKIWYISSDDKIEKWTPH